MDKQEYARRSLQALSSHRSELDAVETVITRAAKEKKSIPNIKDIFKEIGDASSECGSLVEYYDTEDPMPDNVRDAIGHTLQALTNCTSALILWGVIGS
jgi:hypothetical protein